MKDLSWIVASNARAVEKCDHCRATRESLEAHGKFLAAYEVLRAHGLYVEQGDDPLLCNDCVAELVDCGVSLKRIEVPQAIVPWDGSDIGERKPR